MKKIIFKLKKAIVTAVLQPLKPKCKRKSAEILKRGADEYAEFTPAFIFKSLVDATAKAPVIKFNGIIPDFPILKAPDIYFNMVADNLISKMPIIRTEFEKLSRNAKIIVQDKNTGAKLQIKKKQFQPTKHKLIKIAPKRIKYSI